MLVRTYISGFLVLVITLGFVSSCRTKKTCAAYHSHFLLFPESQDQQFSLFEKDTAPKDLATTEKLWNGISVGPDNKRTYKKRHYVIPMKDVYPEESDSNVFGGTSATNLDSTKAGRKFLNK